MESTVTTLELGDLMKGSLGERRRNGNNLLAQLLPESTENVSVRGQHYASLTNPRFVITFKRGEVWRNVICEVGNRLIQTHEGAKPLLSIGQLQQEILSVFNGLHPSRG